MPTYEMPLLLRVANKAQYMTVLKNVANSIFQTGGFIRKIENWGDKDLPCKAHTEHGNYTRAGHFLLCFDAPPASLKLIQDDCNRNLEIIRVRIFKQNEPETMECTLHEELLPPPYRPSVLKLLETGKKYRYPKFDSHSGLGYYPFRK